MPLFYFNLNDGRRLIADPEGTNLPDQAVAHEYAVQVAREIMRNDEHRSLAWRLVVCDAEREPCFELLFASVAENLDHLSPALQAAVERTARSVAALKDSLQAVQMTLLQLRATLARADGLPYLAVLNGQRVDRPR